MSSRILALGAIAAGLVIAGCSSSGTTAAVNSATSAAGETTTETTTTTTTATADPDTVGNRVQEFYEAYLADPQISDHWVEEGYITQNAADSIDEFAGADLVTCSEDPLDFSNYEFSTPKLDSGTGTMSVRAPYDFMTVEIGLGLLEADGEWRINAFECQA